MRQIITALSLAGLLVSGTARAEVPVVVELFTSQGCSSCPPADKMLQDLSQRDDVIALGLHVDYWDYIGWADSFAQPKFTERQRAYARAVGDRMVYTPQFVVSGHERIVGAKPMKVMDAILEGAEMPAAVALDIERDGDDLRIRATAETQPDKPLSVQLVRYRPEALVTVENGENAGHRLSYANIVTSWDQIAEWNGDEALDLKTPFDGDEPAVVILQDEGPGIIRAAAQLR